jgi:hypothetical protein
MATSRRRGQRRCAASDGSCARSQNYGSTAARCRGSATCRCAAAPRSGTPPPGRNLGHALLGSPTRGPTGCPRRRQGLGAPGHQRVLRSGQGLPLCRWEPGTPAPTSIPGASSDQAWPGEHAVTDRRAPRRDQQQPPRSWCSSPRSRLGRSQGPQGRWSTPAAREERPRSDR